jgi:hypothetical protein
MESQGNRRYRSRDMEGRSKSGWDEQYGRMGGYGPERSERYGWGTPSGRGFRQEQTFGQGWQGEQGGRSQGYGQTGKYGQIGAQMSGGRFGECYGQGTFGGFRGKGPKGYERSDERLKEMICERLTDDDEIDASEITVEVRNGEVTLTGTVDDRQMKFMVEDLIERNGGVKEIHNNLRVNRENREGQIAQTGQTGQTGKREMATSKTGSRGNSE